MGNSLNKSDHKLCYYSLFAVLPKLLCTICLGNTFWLLILSNISGFKSFSLNIISFSHSTTFWERQMETILQLHTMRVEALDCRFHLTAMHLTESWETTLASVSVFFFFSLIIILLLLYSHYTKKVSFIMTFANWVNVLFLILYWFSWIHNAIYIPVWVWLSSTSHIDFEATEQVIFDRWTYCTYYNPKEKYFASTRTFKALLMKSFQKETFIDKKTD